MRKSTTAKGFKAHLDTKVCPVCLRPFSWRKKWRNNWANVIYCSDGCRKRKTVSMGLGDER
ncbi:MULTISPECIES: DUF2256 domain-containing protein [Vibrio]|uniref:DUF2256 domain-containing protein n=1 Tax=Vibrio TaxID=662 RepID=UPI000907C8F2|nr:MULTISPECIES: DUF2256 domain-containing protein [Vibrio]